MKKSMMIVAMVALCGTAMAEPVPDIGPGMTGPTVRIETDSGFVKNTARGPQVIYSTLVTEPNAHWLRLNFGAVELSGNLAEGTGSYLRITSMADQAFQYLDAETIQDWQHTSAYFNGDTVLVELIAYPGTGTNRVHIASAIAGEPAVWNPATICGTTDDRKLSKDPRSCRVMPIGCSAWLHDRGGINKGFGSAGHCSISASQVMQFNTPLSSGAGAPVAPPPKDQYAVDAASITFVNGGVGNDYAVFGCKPNSTTGLTAFQAQGAFYTVAATVPSLGVPIRITGYGTTSSPIPNTWSQAQKTHAAGTLNGNGNGLQYNTDTTGGNSGSPVVNDANAEVIGVHTHAGCTSSGGNNQGTNRAVTGFNNALNNPKGVFKISLNDNCYADFDNSNSLTIDDFISFQTSFAIGDVSANCDGSVTLTDPVNFIWTPSLTIDDFICFQTTFAVGC